MVAFLGDRLNEVMGLGRGFCKRHRPYMILELDKLNAVLWRTCNKTIRPLPPPLAWPRLPGLNWLGECLSIQLKRECAIHYIIGPRNEQLIRRRSV